jgi:2-polyprenyl-6-methoxyphenol hydroxylase-like FAD-dependent oxidoreductase
MKPREKSHTPVLIVGAGPVGLLMGLQLQRFGIPHRLIERRLKRQSFSKAFAIHSRSLEIFDDLGLLDQVCAKAVRVELVHIYSNRKRLITYNLGKLNVPHPYVASIPQNCIEEILEKRYIELGGYVERGVELKELTQNDHRACATLNDQYGEQQFEECSWVIGCDGGFSFVRNASGIAFDGETYKRPYIIADGTLSWSGDNGVGHVFSVGDGYMMVFPLPGGKHRVVIDSDDINLTNSELNIERVNARLYERGFEDLTLSNPTWLSLTTFHHRLARQYRMGRVFLAGDACHVHSPIGGQGLNTGLQDAYNLSWKIAHVLNHDASQMLLDTYEAERKPVANTVLNKTRQQMRLLNVKHPLLRFLRDAIVPKLASTRRFQNMIMKQAAGFQVEYSTALLAGKTRKITDQGPLTGERMPDGKLFGQRGNALHLFELLKGTHYSLFIFESLVPDSEVDCLEIANIYNSNHWPSHFLRTFLIRNGSLDDVRTHSSFETVYRITNTLCEDLGAESGGIFLVRPDGYLALRCSVKKHALLDVYFEHFYSEFKTGIG